MKCGSNIESIESESQAVIAARSLLSPLNIPDGYIDLDSGN